MPPTNLIRNDVPPDFPLNRPMVLKYASRESSHFFIFSTTISTPKGSAPPPPEAHHTLTPTTTILYEQFTQHQQSPTALSAASRAVGIARAVLDLEFTLPETKRHETLTALKMFVDTALSAAKTSDRPASHVLALALALAAQNSVPDPDDILPSMEQLIQHSLLRLRSADDIIRTRSLDLLHITALALADAGKGEVDDDIYDLLKDAVLPRLSDKSSTVRLSAVKAAAMLQDASDSSDAITTDLLYVCMHDSSPPCRSAALDSLVVSRHTLPSIICRVRDTTPAVRVKAVSCLKDQVDVRLMTDLERVVALRAGLTPRCDTTYSACQKMLVQGWLKSLKFDVLGLMDLMDVTNNENVCESAAKAILNSDPPKAAKDKKSFKAALDMQFDLDNLTPSSSLLLRVKVENAASIPNEAKRADALEGVLPDTPLICSAIQKHVERHVSAVLDDSIDNDMADDSFVALQLLKISRHADFNEESGRRQSMSMLHAMLTSSQTPDELVESCIRALAVAHKSEVDYLQRIAEVLDEVGDYDAEDENMDATEAAFRQLRIVSIVGVVLEHTKKNLQDPLLAQLSEQILPAIVSNDSMVREAGISCLGKYCLLGFDAAEEYQSLLLATAANTAELSEIRAQALLGMSDLAMLYPSMTEPTDCMDFETEEVSEVSLESALTEILDNDRKGGMVMVAAEVCAKLLMMGRITNPSILAKLLVIYFTPHFATVLSPGDDVSNVAVTAQKQVEADAEDATEVGSPIRVQQMLSIFFPGFTAVNGKLRGEIVAEAARSVLDLLREGWMPGKYATGNDSKRSGGSKAKAKTKKEDKIALDKLLGFIVSIAGEESRVAPEIVGYVVENDVSTFESDEVRDIVKVLSTIVWKDKDVASEVLEMCGDMEDAVAEKGNKTVQKSFGKFVEGVRDFIEMEEERERLEREEAAKSEQDDPEAENAEDAGGRSTESSKTIDTERRSRSSSKPLATVN